MTGRGGKWTLPRVRLRRDGEGRLVLAGILVGGLCVAVAVLALVAREVAWTWQPMIVAAALAHQLLWAAPVGLVLLLAVRRRRAAAMAGLVMTLGVVSQLPVYLANDAAKGGVAMRVLQANLRIGSADPDRVVAAVRDGHVDVAMTEELTTGERDRLIAAGMSDLLPYRLDAALPHGGGGLAIWSRFPLTDEHNWPHFDLGVLSARTTFGSVPVTVVAVHLLPPWPYPDDRWLAEASRVQRLLRSIAGPGPVIVGGDFNATTDTAQFRAIVGDRYRDGADTSGAGYVATYPTDRWFPPLIAIDHVLTHAATTTDLTDLALPGSDHRGLLATVVFAAPPRR